MKRALCVALALVMVMSLTACFGLKTEDVAGIWETVLPDTEVQAEELLLNVEAYEEEIALADLSSLTYVKAAEFREDGTYEFRVAAEGTKACVHSFYADYFANLYEGRTTLNEAYGVSFDEMTEEEFRQFYVELYEFVTYDEMLDHFAEIAYNYESLETPLEEGTYTLKGDRIRCTATGEYDSGDIKAMVTGDNDEHLVLTYSDGVENYDRAG